MKLKNGFTLRKIPGMNLVIPVGENAIHRKSALMLNDTAAMIYEMLQNGLECAEITEHMTAQFDVTAEKAAADIDKVFAMLIEGGVAEE